jgi:hypothetical protein
MRHPIYRVVSCDIVAPYTLSIHFDDDTSQVIDFLPVLAGELYGSLALSQDGVFCPDSG